MDPLEEQLQELEVLQSIYPDELIKHSDKSFDLIITLDTISNKIHKLKLMVEYPSQYPNEPPILSLDSYEDEEGEYGDDDGDDDDDDEEAKQNKRNINLPELIEFGKTDISFLLDKLREESELQIGIPSIFAITTLLKDESENLFTKKLETLEQKREEELNKQEAELSKKFIGTKVTPQSFQDWRLKFRKELKIDEKLQSFYKSQHNGKLSGREIFEKGLAEELDLEALKI